MRWDGGFIRPEIKKDWGSLDLLSFQFRWSESEGWGFIYFQATLLGFGGWVQYEWSGMDHELG